MGPKEVDTPTIPTFPAEAYVRRQAVFQALNVRRKRETLRRREPEWAWHKGQGYWTILCDLERNVPIALLSKRSADALVAFLQDHPEDTIVARDRSSLYAEGLRE